MFKHEESQDEFSLNFTEPLLALVTTEYPTTGHASLGKTS